jgi:hypothetical protein
LLCLASCQQRKRTIFRARECGYTEGRQTALFGSEHVSLSTQFDVALSKKEAISRTLNRFKPSSGDFVLAIADQDAPAFTSTATNATTKLMQGCEPKSISIHDHHHARARNINTNLNDRCPNNDVDLAASECIHHAAALR